MNDTRDTITNFERKVGALPWPNLDDFACVICSTDCSNIYAEERMRTVGFGEGAVRVGLLQMNLRSVVKEGESGA